MCGGDALRLQSFRLEPFPLRLGGSQFGGGTLGGQPFRFGALRLEPLAFGLLGGPSLGFQLRRQPLSLDPLALCRRFGVADRSLTLGRDPVQLGLLDRSTFEFCLLGQQALPLFLLPCRLGLSVLNEQTRLIGDLLSLRDRLIRSDALSRIRLVRTLLGLDHRLVHRDLVGPLGHRGDLLGLLHRLVLGRLDPALRFGRCVADHPLGVVHGLGLGELALDRGQLGSLGSLQDGQFGGEPFEFLALSPLLVGLVVHPRPQLRLGLGGLDGRQPLVLGDPLSPASPGLLTLGRGDRAGLGLGQSRRLGLGGCPTLLLRQPLRRLLGGSTLLDRRLLGPAGEFCVHLDPKPLLLGISRAALSRQPFGRLAVRAGLHAESLPGGQGRP